MPTRRDEYWMRRALYCACRSFSAGEVPIGAVLVIDNQCIAEYGNQVESKRQACFHAELLCLMEAAKKLGKWRLTEATLYCTLEPCTMCWGAMHLYRIARCVYGARDFKHGFISGICQQITGLPKYTNHEVKIEGGHLEEESKALLQSFFRHRRRQNEEHKRNIDS